MEDWEMILNELIKTLQKIKEDHPQLKGVIKCTK